MEQADDAGWTAADLFARLEQRTRVFVLDVRNRDEFDRFPLEGRDRLPGLNLPYFEMLEAGGQDDMVDSVVACVERDLAARLPRDRPILAVCAKGGTSAFVAQGLRRLGYDSVNLEGGMQAWGGFYAVRPVIETAALSIQQISRPARGCLSYLVGSEGRAVVIDPLREVRPYTDLAEARGLRIERVIDSHGHADHISGGPALAAATGAAYHLHPYDGVHPLDLLPAAFTYHPLWDRQRIPVGSQQLEVLHIPGHTLGLVAFRLGDGYLFSGDSIFIRSIARPDLGGNAEGWAPLHARSLRRLLALPGSLIVLPGHFSALNEADAAGLFAAPLGRLRQVNEGLVTLGRTDDAGFVRYLLASLPEAVPEYMDIKRVNAGLLLPDEDTAAVLELGRNVCALAQAYAHAGGGVS